MIIIQTLRIIIILNISLQLEFFRIESLMNIDSIKSYKLQTKQWVNKFLFTESYFSSTVFLLFLYLKELQFNANDYSSLWIFWIGIVYVLITCMNPFFFYSAFIHEGVGFLSPFNIVTGFLASNKKWKLYLLWFSLVYYVLDNQRIVKSVFIVITAFSISFETYKGLIFQTIKDNLLMFAGMMSLAIVRFLYFFLEQVCQYSVSVVERISMYPLLFLLSAAIIRTRIKKIHNEAILNLKSPTLLIQYVNVISNSFSKQQSLRSYILIHKRKCAKTECFCSEYSKQRLTQLDNKQLEYLKKQAINQIYLQAFETHSWEVDDRLPLIQNYAEFLIQCKQNPRAITMLTKLKQGKVSYFNMHTNFAINQKLNDSFKIQIYFDNQQCKLQEIQKYDLQFGYVCKQIREILQNKIEFWKQLCKQNPKLKLLQVMGRKLVNRIEQLHYYFSHKIRPSEQFLSVVNCTILYASYLLLTTNYSQLANLLIKKAQKMMQQQKSEVNNGIQYGIFLKVRQNFASRVQQTYELVIDNISTSLSCALKQQKQNILNKNISYLIPDQFVSIHDKKFDQFYKINNFNNRKSKLIGQIIQLPFKMGTEQVLFLQMNAGIRFDHISNSALIQCLFKRVTSDAINFIVDLQGSLKYKQPSFFQDFVKHKVVKQLIHQMNVKYWETGYIQQIHRKVQQNDNIFNFSCFPLYSQRLKQFGKDPLVRVVIRNDNFRNQKMRNFNLQSSFRFKQVQVGSVHNENDSQASTSSRKDSIENVISVLTQSSSLKTQCFLTITLLLLLIFAVVSFNVSINCFNIWNLQSKQNSPAFTAISLINMKNVFNSAISWYYDVRLAATAAAPPLLNTLYQNSTIEQTGLQMLKSLFLYQRNNIHLNLLGIDNLASNIIKQTFKTQYSIHNPILHTNSQLMTLQNIVANFLVDINSLFVSRPYNKTLLSFSYLQQIYPEFNKISSIINEQIQFQIRTTRTNNIIMISFISFFLLTFLIPLWKFNITNKKKHQQIYNLLASLEAKLIIDEIRKLAKIEEQICVNFNNNDLKNDFHEDNNNLTSLFKINGLPSEINKNQKMKQKTRDLYLIFTGVKKITAQQISHERKHQLNIKIRKRGGQIAIQGSDCDIKKFIFADWVAVFFMVFFLVITHALFWQKLNFISQMDEHFKFNLYQMENMEDASLALLNAKIFSDDQTHNYSSYFYGQTTNVWLRNWIINYNSSSDYQIPQDINIQKCTQDILLCNLQLSDKILQSIIKLNIANAYQQKNVFLRNSTANKLPLVKKSRYMLFFSQQILDFLRNRKLIWLQNRFNQLQEKQRIKNTHRIIFMSIFWFLILVFCIFSIFYTIRIKNKYVKEVTLLSILNKEMIYDNKRVESFVKKLSKNSR